MRDNTTPTPGNFFYFRDRREDKEKFNVKAVELSCFSLLFYHYSLTLWSHRCSAAFGRGPIEIKWNKLFDKDVAYQLGPYFYDYVKAVQGVPKKRYKEIVNEKNES